ncbi:MAG: Nif3-like dinuclear metal center hexameric protein [Clostridia bacterium]|nr:Nif3-like dinuclear metal center hexameric protein [Clostridia bacterium]
MKFNEFYKKIDEIAPFSLSKAMMEKGSHDNSGVILKFHDEVNKVLFTLDLTVSAVLKAVKCGADTIVTHHPAIFYPISKMEIDGENSALANACFYTLNVISTHLNLDIAKDGIDDSLATALGANDIKIIEYVTEDNGYGREFKVEKCTLSEFAENAKKELSLVNVSVFGKPEKIIKKVASFCGGGSSHALKYQGNADLIVTSDMPHHIITALTESGKAVMLITHYSAEVYGFKKFAKKCQSFIETAFYDNKNLY